MALGGLTLAHGSPATYRSIQPTMSARTITLTGHDLSIDEVIDIARHGAKVQLSPDARQRNADTRALMMEGAAEGIPIYLFNRGAGSQREVVQFSGDPLSPRNEAYFQARGLAGTLPPEQGPVHRAPPDGDYDSEIQDEDVARAIMVVRANQMTYLPCSAPVMQAIIDLLNADITPVIWQRGGVGEANGPAAGDISRVIRGGGEAYYHGMRMSAAEALQRAGLKPFPFAPGDSTTNTVNADVTGMAALVVHDTREDDLVVGARWLDIRKLQEPARTFGAAPTVAWEALRRVLPLRPAPREAQAPSALALEFITSHPASAFYPGDPPT